MTEKERKKKERKKKRESDLELMIFRIMEKSLRASLDKALKDIFKDWG